MNYLNNLAFNTLENVLKPEELGLRLIEDKLGAFGIILSEEQKNHLKQQLQGEELDKLSINLTDAQKRQLERTGSDLDKIVLDFERLEEIDELENVIQDVFAKAISEILSKISDSLLDARKSQAPTLLKQQKDMRLQFADRVHEIWSKPLDLLEMLLGVSLEAGADFNEHFRPIASQENDLVFEVLTRLHARGCQVGSEILTLLRNGFADGAHARWRTLHEITVVAQFINKYGNDVAERYLCHAAVIDYKRVSKYQEHCAVLGYSPLSQEEIDEIKSRRDKMIERFGVAFRHTYGWAAEVLGKEKPTFKQIEQEIGIQHLRPFYQLANINIHAGSKSAAFRLGSPPGDTRLLVAGPSIFGLGEPGQNTALSINQLTVTLLFTRPNLDRLAFASTTQKLVNEIFWAFDEIMQELEEKESS
ncbi:MAG: DUF5677 domain-containing protein [Candidatus Bipolaricaulia bacterium]